jgi:hypothetical protein
MSLSPALLLRAIHREFCWRTARTLYYRYIHDWQDLAAGIAGILGFGAAIYTVYTTLRSERRRDVTENFCQ